MPSVTIIIQPETYLITAAYRPVILKVRTYATGGAPAPPVVYCDVYIESVFYKTISKTQYETLNTDDSDWQFDIQDIAQEVLIKSLPQNGSSAIASAPGILKSVFCRFRSSGFDSNGFILPEGTPPVQGTGKTVPTAGTGVESHTFYIVNAVLQHENNQDLQDHLFSFKTGNAGLAFTDFWSGLAWPLTHRPRRKYRICKNDNDFFPIVYTGNNTLSCLKLYYRNKGESIYNSLTHCGCLLSITNVAVTLNNLNRFHLTWTNNGGTPSTFLFEYSSDGGVIWNIGTVTLNSNTAATSTQSLDYTLNYIWRITPICADGTSGSPGTGTFSVAGCDPVQVPSDVSLPNQVIGAPYNYSFTLEGDSPFAKNVITKPAWMIDTLNTTTGMVTYSGTPVSGDTTLVTIEYTNCGGADSDTVNQDIAGGSPFHVVYQTISDDSCQSVIRARVFTTNGNSVTIDNYVQVSGNVDSVLPSAPWDGALPHTDVFGGFLQVIATLDNGNGSNSVASMLVTDNTLGQSISLTFLRANSGAPC